MTDENITTSQAEDAVEPTLSEETDAVGDGEWSSEGNRRPEETVEFWKQRYTEARRGGEQAARNLQQMYAMQQQQMYQQQQQYQAPPIGNDFLMPNEREALKQAKSELDLDTMDKIKDIQYERRQQAAVWQAQQGVFHAAGIQYQQMQEMEFYKRNADLLSDANMAYEIISEAMRIQNDPVESVGIKDIGNPQANVTTPDGQVINRYAIAQAIREKRAELKKLKGGALKTSMSNSIGPAPRGDSEPGRGHVGGKFNPSVHLSADERATIDKWKSRSSVLPDWGYKEYWQDLPEEVRKARLQKGSADVSIADVRRSFTIK